MATYFDGEKLKNTVKVTATYVVPANRFAKVNILALDNTSGAITIGGVNTPSTAGSGAQGQAAQGSLFQNEIVLEEGESIVVAVLALLIATVREFEKPN
jgi:hypothetical protein